MVSGYGGIPLFVQSKNGTQFIMHTKYYATFFDFNFFSTNIKLNINFNTNF